MADDPIGRVYELSWSECEQWMRDLELVRANGKPNWDELREAAGVKSLTAQLKLRWAEGAAPEDRAKIRAVLDEKETKRRKRNEPTKTGARVFAIEEWHRIGLSLAYDTERIWSEIIRLTPIANQVRAVGEARARYEAEQSTLEALSSPTPPARGPRK